MRAWTSVLLATCLCVLASSCARTDSPGHAQPDSTQADLQAPRAPTATEILQSTSRCYASMQSFQVDVDETMSFDRSGNRDMIAGRRAAILARPNRISLPAADATSLAFHADGHQLWTVLGDRYSREPCPDTLAVIADDPLRSPLLQLSSVFLLRLLSEDAHLSITRDVESMALVGGELLDGHRTHRLQFTQPDFDWEMWVAVDEPRLIHRIVIDMSKQLGLGPSDTNDARITKTIRFQNWQIDPPLDSAVFTYRPGDDAQRVDHVMGVSR